MSSCDVELRRMEQLCGRKPSGCWIPQLNGQSYSRYFVLAHDKFSCQPTSINKCFSKSSCGWKSKSQRRKHSEQINSEIRNKKFADSIFCFKSEIETVLELINSNQRPQDLRFPLSRWIFIKYTQEKYLQMFLGWKKIFLQCIFHVMPSVNSQLPIPGETIPFLPL